MRNRLILFIVMCLALPQIMKAQQPLLTKFEAGKRYLKIPVKNGAPKRNVEILFNGEKIRWFDVELADGVPDWYAYLDLSAWKGKSLSIKVDTVGSGSKAFTPVELADKDDNTADYREPLRGQFHFSPKRGWNNDPNGMVFYKGEYHLFFQHNPYGVNWGNMHWGHAVSKDLIHWKEVGEALYPDEFGTMFSGGGVVDVNNTSGLGKAGEQPMVLYYTAAEKSWEQGLAYSLDGRNFTKLPNTILDKITDGNRDPKVIWHEPTKRWVMVLYVTEADNLHTMHFFTSADMKAWTFTSKVVGGKGDDRYMHECPEFFELAVDGDENRKKWVLTGANSQYAIGTFDGKTFSPEQERLFSQHGRDYYAAQTFSDEPKGRRVEIGWWRTPTNQGASAFNQSMSIPMELKLKTTKEGVRLVRTPVIETQKLRGTATKIAKEQLTPETANPLAGVEAETAEIKLTLLPSNDTKLIELMVRGLAITYLVDKQELVIDNVRAHVPLIDGELEMQIFVDRTGVEVFVADGEIFMPVNYNLNAADQNYKLRVDGGKTELKSLELYKLKSIWN